MVQLESRIIVPGQASGMVPPGCYTGEWLAACDGAAPHARLCRRALDTLAAALHCTHARLPHLLACS